VFFSEKITPLAAAGEVLGGGGCEVLGGGGCEVLGGGEGGAGWRRGRCWVAAREVRLIRATPARRYGAGRRDVVQWQYH